MQAQQPQHAEAVPQLRLPGIIAEHHRYSVALIDQCRVGHNIDTRLAETPLPRNIAEIPATQAAAGGRVVTDRADALAGVIAKTPHQGRQVAALVEQAAVRIHYPHVHPVVIVELVQ